MDFSIEVVNEELHFVDCVCFFVVIPDFWKYLGKAEGVVFNDPRTTFGIVVVANEISEENFLLNDLGSVNHSEAVILVVNDEKKRFDHVDVLNGWREVVGNVLVLQLNALN